MVIADTVLRPHNGIFKKIVWLPTTSRTVMVSVSLPGRRRGGISNTTTGDASDLLRVLDYKYGVLRTLFSSGID